MSGSDRPDWLAARIRREPTDTSGLVVRDSTPVVCFGDQRTARVATLGNNPSFREFLGADGRLLTDGRRRLETLESLGAARLSELTDDQVRRVLDGCYDYFDRNPSEWFDGLGPVLANLGTSYEDRTACHLDLVQWATEKVWTCRDLEKAQRRRLLDEDEPFLIEQLAWDRPGAGRLELVLVNGDTCYRQCRDVGVPWVEAERLDAGGKSARFWFAEWHGVRLIGWSTNLAYRPTSALLKAAVPERAVQLVEQLGWTPTAARPSRVPSREPVSLHDRTSQR